MCLNSEPEKGLYWFSLDLFIVAFNKTMFSWTLSCKMRYQSPGYDGNGDYIREGRRAEQKVGREGKSSL